MSAIIKKCFGCCVSRALDKNDTPLLAKRKTLLIGIFCLLLIELGIALPVIGIKHPFLTAASVIGFTTSFTVLVLLVVFKITPTDKFIEANVFICGIAAILADLNARMVEANPHWPLFIIAVDVLLVLEVRQLSSVLVVCMCLAWLFIATFEDILRFGLYDATWQSNSQAHRREKYDCENLPCKKAAIATLTSFSSQVFVFIADFVATRGFALSVLEEKNRILASIDAAKQIATSLSRFDLDSAARLLDNSNIPSELREAFSDILDNLRSYKPYLPHSCLPGEVEEDDEIDVSSRTSSCSMSQSCSTAITSRVTDFGISRRRIFEQTSVSLLIVNICNSRLVLENSEAAFEGLVSQLVAATYEIVGKHRGTLDLFLGDRMFASFGATRVHVGHPTSCVDAANAVVDSAAKVLDPYQDIAERKLRLNIGMGSGKQACGDLGSENMMRFSVIGRLSLFISVIEKAGAILGTTMLGEGGLYGHLMHITECRIILRRVLHEEDQHLVYEFFHKRKVQNEEWMYQLQLSHAGKWKDYNTIAAAFLCEKVITFKQRATVDTGDDTIFKSLRLAMECDIPAALEIVS